MAFRLSSLSIGELFAKVKSYFNQSAAKLTEIASNLVPIVTHIFDHDYDQAKEYLNVKYVNIPQGYDMDPEDYDFVRVDAVTSQDLITVLLKYAENFGINLSNTFGFQFPLKIDPNGVSTRYNGVKAFIYANADQIDLNDCLLIKKQDALQTKYFIRRHINGFIANHKYDNPLTDSFISNYQDTTSEDRLKMLALIKFRTASNYKSNINSNYGLGFIYPDAISDEVLEKELCRVNFENKTKLSAKDLSIINEESNPTTTLTTMVKDLARSSDFSSAFKELVNAVSSNDEQKTATLISSLKNSAYAGTKDPAITSIVDSYTNFGMRGVKTSIIQFLKSASSLSVNQTQDAIEFTENEQYVPKSFIAGAIGGVFQAVGAIATAIAFVFSTAIGPIVALGWSVLQGLFDLINQPVDALTYGSVDSDATTMARPTSIINVESTIEDIEDIDYQWATLLRDYGAATIKIAGGLVIMVNDEENNRVLIEVHITPIPTNSYNAFITAFNTFTPWTSYDVQGVTHYYYGCNDSNRQTYLNALHQTFIDSTIENEFLQTVYESKTDEELDANLREMYTNGFVCCAFALLNLFGGSSTFIIKPWNSNGSSAYGDNDLSQAIEALIVKIKDNNPSSLPTWYHITSGDGYNKLFKLFYYIPDNSLNNITWTMSPGLTWHFKQDFLHILYQVTSWYNDINLDDDPVTLDYELTYGLIIPAYRRETLLPAIVLSVALTLAITGIAVAATIKIRKTLQKWQAKKLAIAEQAWADYIKNPTAVNYTTYRKAAKRNNLIAMLTGGTKLSTSGYWAGTSEDFGESEGFATVYEVITGEKPKD